MTRPKMEKTNLLSNIPADLPEELFEALFQSRHVKIERIVSRGHQTPADDWYDQDWDEWVLVLKGSAGLRFDEKQIRKGAAVTAEDNVTVLGPGEAMLIPSGVKHQVAWTDDEIETVWLAVHIFR